MLLYCLFIINNNSFGSEFSEKQFVKNLCCFYSQTQQELLPSLRKDDVNLTTYDITPSSQTPVPTPSGTTALSPSVTPTVHNSSYSTPLKCDDCPTPNVDKKWESYTKSESATVTPNNSPTCNSSVNTCEDNWSPPLLKNASPKNEDKGVTEGFVLIFPLFF